MEVRNISKNCQQHLLYICFLRLLWSIFCIIRSTRVVNQYQCLFYFIRKSLLEYKLKIIKKKEDDKNKFAGANKVCKIEDKSLR